MNWKLWLHNICSKRRKSKLPNMNRYLIVGLGNIGAEYEGTRHNAGFMVLDALAEELGLTFEPRRYAARAEGRVKNKQLVLIKPSTYMNLSGNAVRYWAKEESIPLENILVVVDDLALPYGTLRLKAKGAVEGTMGLSTLRSPSVRLIMHGYALA